MSDAYAYLILGPANAGRLELVADLIEGGLDRSERACVFVAADEEPAPEAEPLEALGERVSIERWEWRQQAIHSEPPSAEEMVFFITNGRANPVDQVEGFCNWLNEQPHELGAVITVVHCAHATLYPELSQWYDACIHFSDAVLLNRRENVSQSWIREFIERYTQAQRYPCYFEQVKRNRVSKPLEVLDTTPRRISMIFESEGDLIDDLDLDEDDLPEEPFDLTRKPDPFLERLPGGMRAKVLPDITRFLEE